MTRTDVLNMLAEKKISIEEAKALLDTAEDARVASASVTVLAKTGRIRVQNGAQADLTAAQVCAVLKVADKLVAEIRKRMSLKLTQEVKTTTRNGEDDEYTAIKRGDMLFGYSDKQVACVEEFVNGYGKKS